MLSQRKRLFVIGVLLALAVSVAAAPSSLLQSEPPACKTIRDLSLSDLAANCADNTSGYACYGNSVSALLLTGDPASPFMQAGDKLLLKTAGTLQTEAFNLADEVWGLSLLNVYANVPPALSVRGVSYLLLGDVKIVNQVPAETAFEPVEPLTVMALVNANLRSQPHEQAQVVNSVPAGTSLLVDGLSQDGLWARVVNQDTLVWVSRQLIIPGAGDLNALPKLDHEQPSAMQSLCLRTGQEMATECASVPPSLLLVQAPVGVNANITINGLDFTTQGTFVLRTLTDQIMQLYVLSGTVSTGGVAAPAGFTMDVKLSDEGCAAAGQWSNLRPISPEERQLLQTLETIPPGMLDAAIHVPTEAEVVALQRALSGSGSTIINTGLLDCTAFRMTSPLDGLPYGQVTFYWDAARGADNYRVYVVSDRGQVSGPFETGSGNTNLTANAADFGDGLTFQWYVEAYVKGKLACSTNPVGMLRAAPQAQNVTIGGGGGGGGTPGPVASNTPPVAPSPGPSSKGLMVAPTATAAP